MEDISALFEGEFDQSLGLRKERGRQVRLRPQALFAGQDGLDLFRRFLPRVPGYLRPGGWLALEIGSSQGDSVTTLVESSGLREIRLSKDLSGNPRFVFAQMASDPETVPTSQ